MTEKRCPACGAEVTAIRCTNCGGSGKVYDPRGEWCPPGEQHVDRFGHPWSPCPKCEGVGLAGDPDEDAILRHRSVAERMWQADQSGLFEHLRRVERFMEGGDAACE
jgi:hypothetical protein